MKLVKYISAFLVIFVLSGCNNAQPTYSKDYSNEKVFFRNIVVKDEYQAKSIINQLDNSTNKLQTFIELKKAYSIPYNGKVTNIDNGFWTDSTQMHPNFGNVLFSLNNGEYFKYPVYTNMGYTVAFVEKKITKQQFRQLQAEHNNKTLERIASYEPNYINEHNNYLNNKPKYNTAYVQPSNKKEPCKIYMSYSDNKYFEEDSWKVFWDGSCKNGFATGLGREIEKADMIDKWQISVYKKGKASNYLIQKDILNDMLIEGIGNDDKSFLVITDIKVKQNDIEVITAAGERNSKTGINLLVTNSPFWNGSYIYTKEYMGFRYKYINNQANDSTNLEFDFFIENPKNGKNGWAFSKYRDKALISGEWVNNKASQLNLPKIYNDKADAIIKEVSNAQQKAYQAQLQAQKIKKQYLKRICKDSVKVTFMDNDDYKDICHPKSELTIMKKINAKLDKISEAKIAKLEQEKYNAQQQKEEQHRQELLSLERNRLAEIRRHNQETEAAADAAHFQQGMKNLTDQINNMTPKTYNVNHMGSVNMYHY